MDGWSHLLEGKLGGWVEKIYWKGLSPGRGRTAARRSTEGRLFGSLFERLSFYSVCLGFAVELFSGRAGTGETIGTHRLRGKPFQTVNACLRDLQVRTPELYHFEPGGLEGEADFAFVEYIDGKEASDFFQADPEIQDQVFQPLAEMLNRMHQQTRANWGTLHEPIPDASSGCHLPILAGARQKLDYLSANISKFQNHHDKFVQVIEDLAAKIVTRSCYGFIHAELGPNHVLVDKWSSGSTTTSTT